MTDNLILNKCDGKEPFESMYKLNLGLSLDEYESYEAMKSILNIKEKGKRSVLMTMLLNGIMVKKPTISEIRGLLKASLELDNMLTKKKYKIKLPDNNILIGLAGSGKKGIKTINISTPSAIVASTNGAYIVKACSSSTSSKTGSSDFLSLLGININLSIKKKAKILKDHGIMFCSIEKTTPKFAKLYEGVFYAPHAMSFALAALSIPVEVDTIAYGLSHPNVKLSVDVLKSFGIDNAFIYSSTEDGVHYLDELGVSGYANVIGVQNGIIGRQVMTPIKDEFDLNNDYTNKRICEGESKIDNVKKAIMALKGEGDIAIIDAICINSAILLCLAKKYSSLKVAYDVSLKSIKDGSAYDHFIKIIENYGSSKAKIEDILGGKYD